LRKRLPAGLPVPVTATGPQDTTLRPARPEMTRSEKDELALKGTGGAHPKGTGFPPGEAANPSPGAHGEVSPATGSRQTLLGPKELGGDDGVFPTDAPAARHVRGHLGESVVAPAYPPTLKHPPGHDVARPRAHQGPEAMAIGEGENP
jgi:hypothetical protein